MMSAPASPKPRASKDPSLKQRSLAWRGQMAGQDANKQLNDCFFQNHGLHDLLSRGANPGGFLAGTNELISTKICRQRKILLSAAMRAQETVLAQPYHLLDRSHQDLHPQRSMAILVNGFCLFLIMRAWQSGQAECCTLQQTAFNLDGTQMRYAALPSYYDTAAN